jgi:hypothetical protein
MSDPSTNGHVPVRTSDVQPATIGRGTGFTIKEFNRRLAAALRRKGIAVRRRKHAPAPVTSP